MKNKLIYWIPIVGLIFSLMHYDKENGMSVFWSYYQTGVLVVFIWVMAYIQSAH